MNRFQTHSGKSAIVIGVLATLVFAGCGTSERQQPTAAESVAVTPQAAPSPTQQARSKPVTIRSQVVSTKANTAMVLSQIHEADLREIALGKMAEQKASTDEVRAYAEQLVQDHMNADQSVIAMASKSGVHLRGSAEKEVRHHREHEPDQKLRSASGANFDRLFLQESRSDHEALIRKLQQEREDASDDQLEALIDKIVPILEQHRELADVLIKKEKA